MHTVSLLLGVHAHQPVGNFDHVFREAFDRFMEDDRRTAMSRLRDAAVARTQIFRVERV